MAVVVVVGLLLRSLEGGCGWNVFDVRREEDDSAWGRCSACSGSDLDG